MPGARDRAVTVLQIILTSTARAHFPVRVLSLSIFVLGRISSTSSFSEKSIFNLKSSITTSNLVPANWDKRTFISDVTQIRGGPGVCKWDTPMIT